jgi:hypothetical protein
MSRKLRAGMLAAATIVALSIFSVQPSSAQSGSKNAHRTHHTAQSRLSPCERDPRCLESLSRASAYGNGYAPHHPAVHWNDR